MTKICYNINIVNRKESLNCCSCDFVPGFRSSTYECIIAIFYYIFLYTILCIPGLLLFLLSAPLCFSFIDYLVYIE